MRDNNNEKNWTRYRKPERYSREWKEEYLMWYENWRRDHWNKVFRDIRRKRKNR